MKIHTQYIGGKPVIQNGYWHVEWQLSDGGTHRTPFGWKDKLIAESYIVTIMEEASVTAMRKVGADENA